MSKTLDQMDLKQIISLRLDGLSNRKIGDTLSISRNTINRYVHLFTSSEVPLKELLLLDNNSLRELFPIKTTIDNDRFNALMSYLEQVNRSQG